MTVPSQFDSTFVYREIVGSTDMQDIHDLAVQAITGTLPTGNNLDVADRWTSLGGGEYESPHQDPDGANRYMRVLLARESATRLQFHGKERNGSTIQDGRIDFTTSYTGRVWAGPHHLAIEVHYGAGPTYELAHMFMVDPLPVPYGAITPYVGVYTHRGSNGVGYGAGDVVDRATFTGGSPMGRCILMWSTRTGPLTGKTTGGSVIVIPAVASLTNSGRLGKIYQCVVVPKDSSAGEEFEALLDTGVVGVFKTSGANPVVATDAAGRLAYRIG